MMPHTTTHRYCIQYLFRILPIYLERDDSRFHWLRPQAPMRETLDSPRTLLYKKSRRLRSAKQLKYIRRLRYTQNEVHIHYSPSFGTFLGIWHR